MCQKRMSASTQMASRTALGRILTLRRVKGGRGTSEGSNRVVGEREVADEKRENGWSGVSSVSYQSREMSAGKGLMNVTPFFL